MNFEPFEESDNRTDRVQALVDYAQRQVQHAEKVGRSATPELPLDSIPGYVLVQEIKRGGQGVVYEAYRESTKQKVAIKAIREPASAGLIEAARFEREISILAELQHPNIVKLHDGGTAGGRRFIVMEYVPGVPLDVHVHDRGLTTETIVRLFVKICDAVNAAHLHGVVHRDLKPSNILVDDRGEPHVLDFGLAKLTGTDVTGDSLDPAVTITGQFVGSLPWATPEQVDGVTGEIDIRTDVYALGLILFHLLTNRNPYEVTGSVNQVMRSIVDTEPARMGSLRKGIADDLETIVNKCLKKARDDRYQSAGELARDLRRYLAGEPIEAKRDSTWYVLIKTARRHRAWVTVSCVMLAATLAYAATLTVFYQRATSAETRAQKYAGDARDKLHLAIDTLAFMVGEVSDGLRETSGASEVRRAILQGTYSRLQSLAEGQADAPELQREMARAHSELGDVSLALGKISDAELHFKEALSIRQALAESDPDDSELLSEISINLVRVGDSMKERNEYAMAREYYEPALRIDESLVEQYPENVHYLDNLLWSYERMGWAARWLGDLRESTVFSDKQCTLAARLLELDPESPQRLFGHFAAQSQRFYLSRWLGDEEAALERANRTLEIGERLLSVESDNPRYTYRIASVYIDRANVQQLQGDYQSARAGVLKGLAMAELLVAADPGEMVYLRLLWAGYWEVASIEDNEPDADRTVGRDHIRRALDLAQSMAESEPENPSNWHTLLVSLNWLGEFEHKLGNHDQGRRLIERAIETAEHVMGTPRESYNLLCEYSMLLRTSPCPEFRNLDRSLEVIRRAVALTNEEKAGPLIGLAQTLQARGNRDGAIAALHKAEAVVPPGEQNQRRLITKLLNELQ